MQPKASIKRITQTFFNTCSGKNRAKTCALLVTTAISYHVPFILLSELELYRRLF